MQILVLTRARITQVVALVVAIVAVLGGFGIVHWSVAQGGMVSAEASSGLILILALQQHFNPKTAEEPVAVAGSISAFSGSTFALLVGFELVHWSQEQVGLVLGLVAVIITLSTSWAARRAVTPMAQQRKAVKAAHRQGMAAAQRKMSDGSALPGAPGGGA